MKSFSKTVACALGVALLLLPFGQSARAQLLDRYQQLLQQGTQFEQQGNFDRAKSVFMEAGKLRPDDPAAYFALAKLNIAQKKWNRAKHWLQEILKRDDNNLEAHYLLGICERESVTFADPINRRLGWRNAKKHFEKILQKDSTFKQVLFEYALLKEDQNEYEDAIDLCYRQLRLKPDLFNVKYQLFQLYDRFLRNGGKSTFTFGSSGPDQYQIQWLKSRGTDYDIYFLGEKYRRMGKFNRADSIFDRLLNKPLPFSTIPVLLSKVRLYYQTDRPELAEQTYWQAVDGLSSFNEIRFIFDDAVYIMSDQDLQTRFHSLADIKKFYHRFWTRKNPISSASNNLRLAEHYRRLIEAEKDYVFDGLRVAANDPDQLHLIHLPLAFRRNTKFNDKGLVYIRYGQPDEIARTTEQDVESNESWLYKATPYNPQVIFHFEIAKHAPPNDWRLVPVPTDFRMMESRLGWDRDLDRYLMSGDELERNSILHELRNTASVKTSEALAKDRSTWLNEFRVIPLHINVARFFDNRFRNDVQIYLSLPKKTIDRNLKKRQQLRLEFGAALFNHNWDPVDERKRQVVFTAQDTLKLNGDQYVQAFEFHTPLNRSYLALHVRDLDSNLLGGTRFGLKYEPPQPKKMMVSDILLAYNVEPTGGSGPFVRHGLKIEPNPLNRFAKDKPVFVYFELYNLRVQEGISRYEIKQIIEPETSGQNVFQKIAGLFRKKGSQTLTISREQQGASPVSYEFSAIDFSQLRSGKYKMTFKIKDLNSGQETEAAIALEVF